MFIFKRKSTFQWYEETLGTICLEIQLSNGLNAFVIINKSILPKNSEKVLHCTIQQNKYLALPLSYQG